MKEAALLSARGNESYPTRDGARSQKTPGTSSYDRQRTTDYSTLYTDDRPNQYSNQDNREERYNWEQYSAQEAHGVDDEIYSDISSDNISLEDGNKVRFYSTVYQLLA